MGYAHRVFVAVIPLAAPLAAATSFAEPDAKCTARPGSEDLVAWMLVLDDVWMRSMDNGLPWDSTIVRLEDVRSAQMVCWKEAEQVYGLRLRVGAYALTTAGGVEHTIEAGLRDLVRRQAAYHVEHDAYTANLADLPGLAPTPHAAFEMEAAATRWTARYRHDALGITCQVAVGEGDLPGPDMKSGEPLCVEDGV